MPPPTPVTPDTGPMIPLTNRDARKGGVSGAGRSRAVIAPAERAINTPATSGW
jgi:hypothetical protein